MPIVVLRYAAVFSKSAFVNNVLLLEIFSTFFCAFLFLPDLSNIFPHVHKIRQLCYITRSCGKPDVLFVITCELSNVANISCVIFRENTSMYGVNVHVWIKHVLEMKTSKSSIYHISVMRKSWFYWFLWWMLRLNKKIFTLYILKWFYTEFHA